MKKFGLIALFTIVTQALTFAQVSEDKIIGKWVPGHGKAHVEIYKSGNKYYGKTVWLKEPNDPETGKPKLDKNNPESSLRTKPRLGLVILKDFTYNATDKVFEGGKVYDPEKGKEYCGKLTLKDANTIEMKGFLCSLTFLGKSDTWTRAK